MDVRRRESGGLAGRLAFLLTLALPLSAAAAPDEAQAVFFQVDGGAALPLGQWADNFSFPEQRQFGVGPGARFAFGWAPGGSPLFTAGIEGGWVRLGTSDWERFTARQTSRADAEAWLWSLMVAGTVDLPRRGSGPFAAELHGALGLLLPRGEERWQGRRVEYDFLHPTLAGRVGLRGAWRHERWDLWIGADLLVAPGAVRHEEPLPSAGGPLVRSLERRTLTALEPGLGLRCWFSL